MSPTTVLITGAARGLGRGMAAQFLLGTNTTVIAGVRDVKSRASLELNKLPCGSGSKLVVVKIDSTSPNDAIEAVKYARSKENISKIDIAIANAGICEHLVPLADADVEEMDRTVNTNTWGLLRLYQATLPLLREAPTPKLVYISSQLGIIARAASNPGFTGTYGLSKAAGNYMVQKIAAENPWLISLAIDPGLVQTDMGNRGAEFAGLNEAPVTLDSSVQGLVAMITSTTKANAVEFLDYQGSILPW